MITSGDILLQRLRSQPWIGGMARVNLKVGFVTLKLAEEDQMGTLARSTCGGN